MLKQTTLQLSSKFAGGAKNGIGCSLGLKRKSRGNTQPFARLVVLDFEATCDKSHDFHPQEIIEIGVSIVDTCTLEPISEPFQRYIRPTERPTLTDFCTQLTGITQNRVDSAPPLDHVLKEFQAWLTSHGCFQNASPLTAVQSFAMVTWGNWDLQIQLESEMKWRRMERVPWLRRWINLKVAFGRRFEKPARLQAAVTMAGLEWTHGRAHSGVVDAVNTARLAAELIRRGERLEVTGWFDDVAPLNRGLKQKTLFGLRVPDGKKHQPFDAHGKLTGVCCCGKKVQLRTVKRPGANHGRQFLSCGAWQITGGKKCDFFHWVEAAESRA